jgi:hypothetical protein
MQQARADLHVHLKKQRHVLEAAGRVMQSMDDTTRLLRAIEAARGLNNARPSLVPKLTGDSGAWPMAISHPSALACKRSRTKRGLQRYSLVIDELPAAPQSGPLSFGLRSRLRPPAAQSR